MKFLCFACEEEQTLNALTGGEWDVLRRETLAYVDELRRGGHLVVTEPLQSARTAATVRVRGGKVLVTDGPFAETKEMVGGFFLLEARDLDQAIGLASRWPSARLGSIEVRPVQDGLPEDRRYH